MNSRIEREPQPDRLDDGQFPARFPRYAADFGCGGRVTITGLLKQHGYATGHFGKWHIGPDSQDGNCEKKNRR